MMKRSLFLSVMILAILLQTTNYAESSTVSAKYPDKVLELAKGYGSATLGKDNDGDPKITGKIDGIKYTVFFYGCKNNKDCNSLQFNAGWTLQDKISIDKINAWNDKKRFGKAVLDSDGDPRISIDFPLSEVPTAYLESFFDWWQIALKEFSKYITE